LSPADVTRIERHFSHGVIRSRVCLAVRSDDYADDAAHVGGLAQPAQALSQLLFCTRGLLRRTTEPVGSQQTTDHGSPSEMSTRSAQLHTYNISRFPNFVNAPIRFGWQIFARSSI
jgi:hypothetical protein